MLSSSTIREILSLIDDSHLAFIAEILGHTLVTQDEIKRLRKNGLLEETADDLIQEAWRFGVYSGRLTSKAPEDVKLGEFLRFVGGTVPVMSFEEKMGLEHAKANIAEHIRGLGNTLSKDAHSILIEGNKKERRTQMLKIRGAISEGISQRKTVKDIAQGLKKLIGDNQRDWLRVAATEVNNVFQEGRLASIVRASGGKDPMVFKRVAPSCCAYCRILYVEKNGKPRLFKLSALIANGSNIGRKAGRPSLKHTGWKPVVESTHPWCQCVLTHMPEGFGFDKHGQMVYLGLKS